MRFWHCSPKKQSRLKNCKSKQEAQEAFSAAVGSISDKDPDRDMIIQALKQSVRKWNSWNKAISTFSKRFQSKKKKRYSQGRQGDYSIPANSGAAITVSIPDTTMERLLIAPSISPSSIALAVPMAWDEVPSASPLAIGS